MKEQHYLILGILMVVGVLFLPDNPRESHISVADSLDSLVEASYASVVSYIETENDTTQHSTNDIASYTIQNTTLLNNTHYVVEYDNVRCSPKLVYWKLYKWMLIDVAQRPVHFSEDRRVNCNYTHYSGYDRGHMAPAADFDWDQAAQNETFLFSNISPQTPNLNRGIWKRLEDRSRNLALQYDSLTVMCGPIFSDSRAIPTHFWKVIVLVSDGNIVVGSWVFPNIERLEPNLSTYLVNINQIERITKINFFSGMTNEESFEDSNNLNPIIRNL